MPNGVGTKSSRQLANATERKIAPGSARHSSPVGIDSKDERHQPAGLPDRHPRTHRRTPHPSDRRPAPLVLDTVAEPTVRTAPRKPRPTAHAYSHCRFPDGRTRAAGLRALCRQSQRTAPSVRFDANSVWPPTASPIQRSLQYLSIPGAFNLFARVQSDNLVVAWIILPSRIRFLSMF